MKPHVFCVMLATAVVVTADICRDPICEFTFVIRRARSMTYRASNGNLYDVALKGRRLQIVENSFRKASSDPIIGTFVDPNDVITLDGFQRDFIAVNGAFRGPTIEVMEGTQVVVHVINDLMTEGITIHWHGMFVPNTPWMDGVGYVTQCPIPPNQSFTYRFKALPHGTHWYHDHFSNTRLDGLFGMLIIHQKLPKLPEFIVSVQDWYHVPAGEADRFSPNRLRHTGTGEAYMSDDDRDMAVDNSEVSMRRYDGSLINGRGRWNDQQVALTMYNVSSGQKYRFRVANTGCERGYLMSVDGHQLRVIALEGEDTAPLSVDSFIIYPGESLDFEMDASKRGGQYWMRAVTLRVGKGRDPRPDGIVNGVKAIVRYQDVTGDAEPTSRPRDCTSAQPCRVFNCPFGGYPASENKICLKVSDAHIGVASDDFRTKYGLTEQPAVEHFLNWNGVVGSSVNARRFVFPKMPFFLDYHDHIVPCDDNECDTKGCKCTNVLDLPYNETIQMVFTNYNPINANDLEHHPIHMHGHNFAVLAMGYPQFDSTTGRFVSPNTDIDCTNRLCTKPRWRRGCEPALNLVDPPVRDVVIVPAGGYTVIRFRSTNPGFWIFHCHLEMHIMEGMGLVLRVGEDRVPQLPRHFPTCNVFDWTSEEFEWYQTNTVMTSLPPTLPTHPPVDAEKRKEITCFTFDDGFTGTSGEWVSNSGNVGLVNGDCVSRQCAHFAGANSRLEVPRFSAAFEAWREFSLSFWLRNMVDGPCEVVTNGDCQTGDPPSLYVYGGWSGQLKVGMTTKGGHVATATVRITLRRWHHVVVTWDGSKMKTYVDGRRMRSNALPGSKLASPNCPLTFGKSTGSTRRVRPSFSGYLDQVCLYNEALSAANIRKLKTNPSTIHLPTSTRRQRQ
ncbi:hypothetical protein NP493_1804g00021 [Ridgeia piscesae]|uniref:LamG-like jellyroll fold domain-containing protein n=1 Tax=Ridgeia piscesae TaxID=27915 RepID=A0AAD9JS06_RIDPI|nr:hypothetical protein NP493_1804g00021 [Ridgeia piscesae]